MPIITDEFRQANLAEAGLWFVIAATAVAMAMRKPAPVRRRCLVLAVTLVAFGFSDVVETRTGAWWRPWWLLAWKAACVAILVVLLVEHYRGRYHARRAAGPPRPSDVAP